MSFDKVFILGATIEKICKKFKYSNNGFLSYQQDTANPAHLAVLFCPILISAIKKSLFNSNILRIFEILISNKIGMKKVFKR